MSAIAFLLSSFSWAINSLFNACASAIWGSISFFTSASKEYLLLVLSALGLTIFSLTEAIPDVASYGASTAASSSRFSASIKA